MRLLVAGKSGQVASALARRAAENAIEALCLGRPELDLTRPETIGAALKACKPDIVVNAAAYTAVDKAESEEEEAFALNADGIEALGRECASRGIPTLHLSTDYVFSGDKETPYVESDPTGPTGAYGRSKLAGEIRLRAANPRHVILRTAWVFNRTGGNFPRTMLRLAADRDTINVVSDQIGNPTDAEEIAHAIFAVASTIATSKEDCWGTWHFAGPLAVSWADFARMVMRASASHGGPSAEIRDISTAQYPTSARRPANSRLESGAFARQFGYRHTDLAQAIDRAMPDWLASG